jgi:hypothetical protein
MKIPGGVLLSHPVTRAVPSALEGLTSGFEMGPGVPPPLLPPKHLLRTTRDDHGTVARMRPEQSSEHDSEREQESSPRPISTGQLHTLPCFHFPPINLVVCEGPYLVEPVGDLISR